jgi:DNA-binding CsgD family transcriptional regulator
MTNIPNQLIIDQIPSSVAWKDVHLKYLGANKNLINSMGLKHAEQLIGIDDKALALNSPEMIEFFKQQDLLALHGNSVEIIHTLDESPQNKTYFLQKSPLRDEQNEIVGIIYLCSPLPQEDLIAGLKQIDQKHCPQVEVPDHYVLDTNHNPVKLSDRELECLFLQLRGKTAKQIAEILKLSKRTVEYYIDNMKSKFGCFNKAELLIAAISLGYQQHVPKNLLNLNLPHLLSY